MRGPVGEGSVEVGGVQDGSSRIGGEFTRRLYITFPSSTQPTPQDS